MHVYVDHSILEIIVNNATAFVVYIAPSEDANAVAFTKVPRTLTHQTGNPNPRPNSPSPKPKPNPSPNPNPNPKP